MVVSMLIFIVLNSIMKSRFGITPINKARNLSINTFRLMVFKPIFSKGFLASIFRIDAFELQAFDIQQLFGLLAIFQWNRLTTRTLFFLFFAILTNLVKVQTSMPLALSRPRGDLTNKTNHIVPYFRHSFAQIFKRSHFQDLFRISLFTFSEFPRFFRMFTKFSRSERASQPKSKVARFNKTSLRRVKSSGFYILLSSR